MIAARELRIGNWIKWTFREPTFEQVTSLSDAEINESAPNLYEPIPLTPEILEQCGFVGNVHPTQDGDVRFWLKNNRFEIEQPLKSGNVFKYCGYDYITIQYLHQLQNLYFALTGEELTINLIQLT